MAKEEGLEGDVKFGRGGHQQGTQLNREISPGRWAHNQKALRCITAKRARGTKSSPVAAERSTRRAAKNRHWAAEITKVRGGTAKDIPGDQRSNTIIIVSAEI